MSWAVRLVEDGLGFNFKKLCNVCCPEAIVYFSYHTTTNFEDDIAPQNERSRGGAQILHYIIWARWDTVLRQFRLLLTIGVASLRWFSHMRGIYV